MTKARRWNDGPMANGTKKREIDVTHGSGDGLSNMRQALTTAETFDRAQVADLISRALACSEPAELIWAAAWEAGYWARVAEENAAYPPERLRLVSSAGEDAIRVHRAREGVDVVEPREGDFQGIGVDAVRAMRGGWPE